jgi:hypothetical protein
MAIALLNLLIFRDVYRTFKHLQGRALTPTWINPFCTVDF